MRPLKLTLGVATSALLLSGLSAGTAQAEIGVATCVGGVYQAHLSPGLTVTPRDFGLTGSGTLTGCLSLLQPSANGNAIFTLSGSGNGSCTSGGTATFQAAFTWADGATSSATGTSTTTVAAGIPVTATTASISSGRFNGSLVTALVNTAFNGAACASPAGMTDMAGGVTLFAVV